MNYRSKNWINSVLIQLLLIFLSLFVLIPLWMILINSVKNAAEASDLGLRLPSHWMFVNYYHVIVQGKLVRGFLNSAFITFSSVSAMLLTGAFAAYIISRRQNIYTNLVFLFFLLGLMAPPQIVPTIKVLQFFGIQGTYLGIILFYTGIHISFSVLLITGFIRSIPRELDESAMVDGCKPYFIFIRIILPLLKPIFATTFVLLFMFVWNDFEWPLFLLNNSSKWTIPMSVYNFSSAFGNRWDYVFANLILASSPIIIIYIFAQNFIIKGLTAGAIKG